MNWKEEIKNWRIRKGFSQVKLAELLDVSQKLVSKWENGEATPRGRSAIALSSLMGLDIALLVLSEKTKVSARLAS